jgi:outer membrane protein TolC
MYSRSAGILPASRRHRRVCFLCALAVVAASVALTACEGPMRDYADAQAYGLIDQRQRQTLGETSQTAIGPGEIPLRENRGMYARVPPTFNQLPQAAGGVTDPPASAPATSPSSTREANGQTAGTSVDELLKNLPGIDLDKMPDLPVFPKPAASGKTRRSLSLDDAFNYALAHNREYMARKEDLYVTALNVALERHAFEPRLFAATTLGVVGNGEASDYSAAFNASQTVGVRQRLPLGGEVVAQALTSTIQQVRRSVSTANDGTVSVALSVPLLRGAGTIAQEDLISAERAMVYEVRDFERFRRGFLLAIAAQYFNLVNQRAQIINRFRNVKSYIFITERSKALFEAGMARRRTTLLDVMRAAQSEYQARSSLINAIEAYELALDRFKILLGMPVEEPIDVTSQYLTIAPPDISDAQAVEIARRLRLDLQTVRDQVDDSKRQVKNASNGLLPDLRLNAAVGMGNSQESVVPQFEQLDYSTGLTLDWPLDRVAERNAYRVALINLDRARRNVESAEDQAAGEVRSSLRGVRQQQVVLAIQKSNIELAQKRKEFSDIQFRDGEIDNRDYLEAETALLDAQNSFARALSDLQVSVLQFLRDTDQLRVDFEGRLLLPEAAARQAETRPAATATMPAEPPK